MILLSASKTYLLVPLVGAIVYTATERYAERTRFILGAVAVLIAAVFALYLFLSEPSATGEILGSVPTNNGETP